MSAEKIKEFLANMVNQDNRSTAFPHYYVIRTQVEEMAPLDNCDERKWYWQDSTYDSIEEIKKICREDGLTEREIEEATNEAQEFGIRRRWERRGMFLTESDAKAHLKANYYHYSSNAHDYVEHAWRAPELKEFLENLIAYFEVKRDPTHD